MIPLLSVVVPVYNVERYLKRCLDSIVSQDIKDQMEIITINDASTDSSLTILREYEKRYPQIITIIDLKTNQGLGGARYIASKLSLGKYIGFVDSDDYLKSNSYFSCMVEALEKEEADVAVTGFSISRHEITGDNKLEEVVSINNIENKFRVFNTAHKEIENIIDDIGVTVWTKVYKRNFYTDGSFNSKIPNKLNEDGAVHPLLFFAKKIVYVPSFDYVYIHREGSLMDYTKRRKYTYSFFEKECINWSSYLLYERALLKEEEKPSGLDKYIYESVGVRIFGSSLAFESFIFSPEEDRKRIAKKIFSYISENRIKTKFLFSLAIKGKRIGLRENFLIFLASIASIFKKLSPKGTLFFFYFINFHLRENPNINQLLEKVKKFLKLNFRKK